MAYWLNKGIMIVAIFMFYVAGVGYAAETNNSFKIGILPCNNIEMTFK